MSSLQPWEISHGDTVRVNINNAHMTLSHKAKVHRIPAATGDSWVFEDLETGEAHYVSEGCTITKLKKST